MQNYMPIIFINFINLINFYFFVYNKKFVYPLYNE